MTRRKKLFQSRKRKKLFQIGDKVVLRRHRYTMYAAKIGATATVTKEEEYHHGCQAYLIGVKWDRGNGLDERQSDGGYPPGDFGLWNAVRDDPRQAYSDILEAEETFSAIQRELGAK